MAGQDPSRRTEDPPVRKGDAQAEFIRMKSTSKKRIPSIVNLPVKRRYLTQREIDRLMDKDFWRD